MFPSRRLLSAALLAILPASASAQRAFEGTVTYRMEMEGRSVDAKFMSKGHNTRMEIAMPGMPDPIVVLIDNEAMISRTVMASMGMYMETDLKQPAGSRGTGNAAPLTVESLGTREEIAGVTCENYRLVQGDKPATEICGATGMGWFMGGMSNPMGGRGGADAGPDWAAIAKEFKDGLLPLRVRTQKGNTWTTMMTAVALQRGALSDDLFQLPAGLRKMSMPGGQ